MTFFPHWGKTWVGEGKKEMFPTSRCRYLTRGWMLRVGEVGLGVGWGWGNRCHVSGEPKIGVKPLIIQLFHWNFIAQIFFLPQIFHPLWVLTLVRYFGCGNRLWQFFISYVLYGLNLLALWYHGTWIFSPIIQWGLNLKPCYAIGSKLFSPVVPWAIN